MTPDEVRGCQDRITTFLQRYLPRFYRFEQRTNAALVVRGLVSGLQRKTCEPIAVEAGVRRKPVQNFVGAGSWDDEAVMAEHRLSRAMFACRHCVLDAISDQGLGHIHKAVLAQHDSGGRPSGIFELVSG